MRAWPGALARHARVIVRVSHFNGIVFGVPTGVQVAHWLDIVSLHMAEMEWREHAG